MCVVSSIFASYKIDELPIFGKKREKEREKLLTVSHLNIKLFSQKFPSDYKKTVKKLLQLIMSPCAILSHKHSTIATIQPLSFRIKFYR